MESQLINVHHADAIFFGFVIECVYVCFPVLGWTLHEGADWDIRMFGKNMFRSYRYFAEYRTDSLKRRLFVRYMLLVLSMGSDLVTAFGYCSYHIPPSVSLKGVLPRVSILPLYEQYGHWLSGPVRTLIGSYFALSLFLVRSSMGVGQGKALSNLSGVMNRCVAKVLTAFQVMQTGIFRTFRVSSTQKSINCLKALIGSIERLWER